MQRDLPCTISTKSNLFNNFVLLIMFKIFYVHFYRPMAIYMVCYTSLVVPVTIFTQCREYTRGRRERRNRFRPADVALFSSESDKNVALIFCKVRCFNIHFNIHTCHQLVFDLGRSSTRYPSGLHKKSILGRGPVWEGS